MLPVHIILLILYLEKYPFKIFKLWLIICSPIILMYSIGILVLKKYKTNTKREYYTCFAKM